MTENNSQGIEEMSRFALDVIRLSGEEAMKFYGKGDTKVKFDEQLVTQAENHLTEGAPLSLKITDGTRVLYSTTLSAPARRTAAPVLSATTPVEAFASRPSQIYATIYYTHCSEGFSAVCVPAKAAWKFEASFNGTGPVLELAQ